MLIKCPECDLQVSDKAVACPHCGYPMIKTNKPRIKKSSKHRRLPNGFGQITLLKNKNLRNPWRAMITVGRGENGRPICKLLKPVSYFSSYNDAYAALVEYNKNPYDLDDDITMTELYERWSKDYFATLHSESSIRTIKSAWAYCDSIKNMRVKDVRARHIKGCIEDGTVTVKNVLRKSSPGIKSRMKSLFNLMLDYALEYEMVNINYARTFQLSDDIIKEQEKQKRGHIVFTEDEMKLLWDNVEMPYVNIILMQCYSGWRPQELCKLELENISLTEWYFIGGVKTDAGRNRKVPIHPKIRDIVRSLYEQATRLGSRTLVNCIDSHTHRSSLEMTYDKYQKRFAVIVKELGLNPQHRAHDPRKHFITMAKKAGVDEYAIKKMVGHNINDITEKVYTERPFSWLEDEISKIK